MMRASYTCLGCGHKFHSEAGPTNCPKCEYVYVKWENYEAVGAVLRAFGALIEIEGGVLVTIEARE